MLEAAGGGGGTDWWGMSMEQIHSLSQSPDIDSQYQIVDGWQKSADLISDHMAQVQDYRDALATAWPPAKSSAAMLYLDRLDSLINNLNETYEAALANGDALSSASLSLSLAKTEMTTVYSQWDTNNKALLAFNQQQTQKASSGQPTPSPSPSPSGEEPAPVTASQQEALRQKAITLMSGVSSDLAQAQLKVVRPAPYQPSIDIEKGSGSGGAGTGNVPTLPPIIPTSFSSGSRGSSGGSSSSTHGSTTFPTTSTGATSNPGTSFPGGNGGNPGLVLGGANPPSTTLPPSSTVLNPIANPPSSGGVITNPGILPPGTGPFVPNGTLPRATGSTFPGEGGGLRTIGGGLPEGGLRAMPPGGVIGRTPSSGLSEPSEARFGTQRVNPVGGVIGEQSAGGLGGRGAAGFSRDDAGFNGESMVSGGPGASGGRGGSAGRVGRVGPRGTASEQPYGQAGGRRAGRRDQAEDKHWDPNNPWATDEGVDPVVLPPAEQRIDPGPAIGLS